MGILGKLFGPPDVQKLALKRDVEGLVKILGHEKVGWEAARALEELRDSRAIDPLIAALSDQDSKVRERAAELLGKMQDPRAIQPLIAALSDEEWLVRSKVNSALEKLADKAVDPLLAALANPNSLVREGAARALGNLSDPRAVEPLIAALKDEYDVRKRAAYSLGRLGDRRAVEPLTAFAVGTPNCILVNEVDVAICALLAIGGPQLEQALASIKSKVAADPSLLEQGWTLSYEKHKREAAKYTCDICNTAQRSLWHL